MNGGREILALYAPGDPGTTVLRRRVFPPRGAAVAARLRVRTVVSIRIQGEAQMKVLVIGGSGTIGRAVVQALQGEHEVLSAARNEGDVRVDITSADSIREMYRAVGRVDAVVSAAGGGAWKPLDQLTDEDFETSLHYKLMGQVNVVRFGFEHVADDGSITVTSGVLAQDPMPGSGAISLVNAGLEGFARAAALEAPRGIRVNVVSPPWVSETLQAMGMDPAGGMPAADVARAYVEAVRGTHNGQVLDARKYG
jgi:NAD(P)-dependent dehydrogenase (short-subunit alcohol dehydrogenase family)